MISIQLEHRIIAILELDDRELTVDEIINRLRIRGQFPVPNGNLDIVRDTIRAFIHGYFSHQLEAGETDATDITPH